MPVMTGVTRRKGWDSEPGFFNLEAHAWPFCYKARHSCFTKQANMLFSALPTSFCWEWAVGTE